MLRLIASKSAQLLCCTGMLIPSYCHQRCSDNPFLCFLCPAAAVLKWIFTFEWLFAFPFRPPAGQNTNNGQGGKLAVNPDYTAFVLVPVFFLLGLLGVVICHVLKRKGYRCTTAQEDEEECEEELEDPELGGGKRVKVIKGDLWRLVWKFDIYCMERTRLGLLFDLVQINPPRLKGQLNSFSREKDIFFVSNLNFVHSILRWDPEIYLKNQLIFIFHP